MPEEGIEGAKIAELMNVSSNSRRVEAPRVDGSARELVAFGPNDLIVENALARAIEGAVIAQRWDIVMQIARELEARRLAVAGTIDLAKGARTRARGRT